VDKEVFFSFTFLHLPRRPEREQMVSGAKTYGRLDREMTQKTKYLFTPPS
jgi:hypothetical protein